MKLLLLHMHVIVNMKNLFEHTILGNMSWFFWKPQSRKPRWCILVPRTICNYMYCCGWDNMIATSKSYAKIHGPTPFKKWITFFLLLNTFFYIIFQHQCCTKSKFSLHIDLHFCFWQQLFNTLTIINPKVSPFNQGCCSFHLIAFKSRGDISKNK